MLNLKNKFFLSIVSIIMIITMFYVAINLSNKPYNIEETKEFSDFILYSTKVNTEKSHNNLDINNILEQNKSNMGIISVRDELKLTSKSANALGDIYNFQQVYNGVEVYGRSIKVAVAQNGEIIFSGNFYKNIAIKESKLFSIESALEVVKKQYNAENSTYRYIVYSLENTPCFAVKVDFADNYAIVDLKTLDIISYVKGEKSAIQTMPYKTEQTNVLDKEIDLTIERTINQDAENNYEYFLADCLRNIYIIDNGNDDEMYKLDQYYSNKTGLFSDKTAVSALENFVKSYDFYANKKNTGAERHGLRGDNNLIHDDSDSTGEQIIFVLVHFGTDYENAFYTKTENSKQYEIFAFGDGNPQGLHNLIASLDVVGHEYHHGIENNIAPLRYLNEAGAISESVADIFGSLIQGYELSDEKFWLIGEDAVFNKKSLRDMKNPSSLLYSNNTKYPENMKYQIKYCNNAFCNHSNCDNGGVHGNSSILNKANYLMYIYAEEVFNKENMGKLWYSASSLFTYNLKFIELYNILLTTARNLGLGDKAIEAIKKAYTDVGIANENSEQYEVIFNGNGGNDKGKKPDNMFVEGGKTLTIPQCSLVKNDSHFLFGWVNGADISDYDNIYKVGDTLTMPNSNLYLSPLFLPKMWNGLDYTGIEKFDGKGSIESPYLIKTADDLAQVAYYYNTMPYFNKKQAEYKNFKLVNDIDLLNIQWMPIGFKDVQSAIGYFDGNYKVISNLNVAKESDFSYAGLFGCLSSNSTVKNLTIKSGEVFGLYMTGGFAGVGVGTVSGLINYAKISSQMHAGGIIGGSYLSSTKIEKCINYGEVTGVSFAGGIVGDLSASGYEIKDIGIAPVAVNVSNCINSGKVNGNIVGGIAGSVVCANIVNNINIGNVTAVTRKNYLDEIEYAKAGGIVGDINFSQDLYPYAISENIVFANSMVANNKSSAEIISDKYIGSLIGYAFNPNISGKLYVNNNVTNEEILIGNKYEFTKEFEDMYEENNNTVSTDNLYTGSYDFDNKDYLTSTDNWYISNYSNIYAVDIDWRIIEYSLPTITETKYWIDYASSNYESGDGSKENPYLIKNAEQLAKLSKDYSDKQLADIYSDSFIEKYKYFKVIADIDLQGKVWIAIGGEMVEDNTSGSGSYDFFGEFDGNNHTITNMFARNFVFNKTQYDKYNIERVFVIHSSASLFSEVSSLNSDYNSIVKNVNLININTESDGLTAGICGSAGFGSVVENCSVDGNINGREAGGIVGKIVYSAIIKNCTNKANIFAQVSGGGIVGSSKSYKDSFIGAKIINCDNYGDISLYNNNYLNYLVFAGGIIGEIDLPDLLIDYCMSYGQINTINVNAIVGGIAGGINRNSNTYNGMLKLEITNCFSNYSYIEVGTNNNKFDALLGGIKQIATNKPNLIILNDNLVKGENNKIDVSKLEDYGVGLSQSNNNYTKEDVYKHIYNIDDVETVYMSDSKDFLIDIPSKYGYTMTAPYWETKCVDFVCYYSAIYTINEYNISFVIKNENGEIKNIANYTLKHGESIVAPKSISFSSNQQFLGWIGYKSFHKAQSDVTYVGQVNFIKFEISFYYRGFLVYNDSVIKGEKIILPDISQFVLIPENFYWDIKSYIANEDMRIELVRKNNPTEKIIAFIPLLFTVLACALLIIIIVNIVKNKKS